MDGLAELRARTAGAGGLDGFAGVSTRWAQVGEEIVLIEADSPRATADALAELMAMLVLRNFPRSAVRVGKGGVAATLAAASVESGLGAEVSLEAKDAQRALFAPRPLAAVVTCRRNAHLALALVAERGTAFHAQAIGRVVEQGFLLRVNGEAVLECAVSSLR